MSYFDKLPVEVQNYLFQYVPYKKKEPLFLNEYKEIIVDWFNKSRIEDKVVYKKYSDIDMYKLYDVEITFMLHAFFFYIEEKKLFYKLFCSKVGEFSKIPKRVWNYHKKIKID